MKKNVMMRLASVLLIAVLISTSAISGTYAKYVTSDNGSDSARVAKWGVVIEAEDFGMFEPQYETDDSTATFTGDFSVKAYNGTDDLLAPGTKGAFADISITGTPEVAVDVAIVPNVTVSDNWIVDGEFYCPVVITVGTADFCGLDYDSATEFAAAIAGELSAKSAQYAPNTNLAELYDNDSDENNTTDLDLSWEWFFEGEGESETAQGPAGQTDAKDTALGDLAANGNNLEISIAVDISVTQID